MIWRLASIGAFILIMVPFMIVAPATVLAAGVTWIAAGAEAADRVLLNPVLYWVVDWPFTLAARGKR
jgi:hypothetical protein